MEAQTLPVSWSTTKDYTVTCPVSRARSCLRTSVSAYISKGRLLRHLASMGYIQQAAPEEYRPTNFNKAITTPSTGDGYRS